jgi:dTDP-4-dehydrorhamnose 3,5-epimerase-like enzyme
MENSNNIELSLEDIFWIGKGLANTIKVLELENEYTNLIKEIQNIQNKLCSFIYREDAKINDRVIMQLIK